MRPLPQLLVPALQWRRRWWWTGGGGGEIVTGQARRRVAGRRSPIMALGGTISAPVRVECPHCSCRLAGSILHINTLLGMEVSVSPCLAALAHAEMEDPGRCNDIVTALKDTTDGRIVPVFIASPSPVRRPPRLLSIWFQAAQPPDTSVGMPNICTLLSTHIHMFQAISLQHPRAAIDPSRALSVIILDDQPGGACRSFQLREVSSPGDRRAASLAGMASPGYNIPERLRLISY